MKADITATPNSPVLSYERHKKLKATWALVSLQRLYSSPNSQHFQHRNQGGCRLKYPYPVRLRSPGQVRYMIATDRYEMIVDSEDQCPCHGTRKGYTASSSKVFPEHETRYQWRDNNDKKYECCLKRRKHYTKFLMCRSMQSRQDGVAAYHP